jgi:hypothetical protein
MRIILRREVVTDNTRLYSGRRNHHSLVQRNHHADGGSALHLVNGAAALKVEELGDAVLDLGRQPAKVLGAKGEAPELVDAADGADEVAVADVGQGAQVRLVAAGLADLAPGPDPVPRLAARRGLIGLPRHLDAVALKGGAAAAAKLLLVVVLGRGPHTGGHGHGVVHLAAGHLLAHVLGEGHGDGEDGPAALPRLHRAGAEGLAVAHPLHVVQDGHRRVTRQHKVAVIRVYHKV